MIYTIQKYILFILILIKFKKNIKNIYGLSPMQEGMLMHTVYGDSPLAYFEQTRYRITGDLDIAIFTETWQLIVQRHDILRTIFVY